MNIEPIIFFDMLAAILILSVALAAVIFYCSDIIKKQHSNDGAGNLSDTRQKALNLIDDANNKALDIINKVTLSTDIASQNFKDGISRAASIQTKEFEKATSDFTRIYSQILHDLKTKNIAIFQSISKDIEVSTAAEIKNFKESMQKLTVLSQKEVRKKIDTDYETAKKEIDVYRKEELQKIDSKIYELLEKVSKLVLGKALSLSEHENLIEKSLEKAKKEGGFRV